MFKKVGDLNPINVIYTPDINTDATKKTLKKAISAVKNLASKKEVIQEEEKSEKK